MCYAPGGQGLKLEISYPNLVPVGQTEILLLSYGVIHQNNYEDTHGHCYVIPKNIMYSAKWIPVLVIKMSLVFSIRHSIPYLASFLNMTNWLTTPITAIKLGEELSCFRNMIV
jgi:hypothetical protein